jgi:phage I-like protein
MLNTLEQQTTPRFMATLEPQAGEAPGRVRIPLALAGTWVRGSQTFSITPQDLESIVRNFRERQNGEINVDYDHASEMPEVAAGGPIPSAGRIVAVDPPETSGRRTILWGWFEPTERARALIRNHEYRYISPAIDWGATHKRTGKPQGATLTSVALTNRPFLEEMPQIHLSDPAYRLVEEEVRSRESEVRRKKPGARSKKQEAGRSSIAGDNGQGTTDDADGGGNEKSQIPDSRFETGGSMKKVKLSVADGKVRINHPDLTDEYYAEPEDLASALAELSSAPDATPDAADEPSEVPLEQAASVLSEAEAQGKSIPAVEFFRARVDQALEEAVRSGKILPRRRADWRRIALADFNTFTRLISEQPARIPLRPTGFSGGIPENAPAQVKFLAEQRMRERGISYGQALSEIGREQPDLIHHYRRAVSGE